MDALFSYILEELELPNGSGCSVSHDVIYNMCLVRTSGISHGVCSQEPSKGPAPLCLSALICSPRVCFIMHICSLLPSSPHLRSLMNQRLSQQFQKAPSSHTASTEMEVISLIATDGGICMWGVNHSSWLGSLCSTLNTLEASYQKKLLPFLFLIHLFHLSWLLAILNSWFEDISPVCCWKSCFNYLWETLFLPSGKFADKH